MGGISRFIGIVVSIVIGVCLMPVVSGAVEGAITDNSGWDNSIKSLLRILPIIVVTILIMGAVGYFAFAKKD